MNRAVAREMLSKLECISTEVDDGAAAVDAQVGGSLNCGGGDVVNRAEVGGDVRVVPGDLQGGIRAT